MAWDPKWNIDPEILFKDYALGEETGPYLDSLVRSLGVSPRVFRGENMAMSENEWYSKMGIVPPGAIGCRYCTGTTEPSKHTITCPLFYPTLPCPVCGASFGPHSSNCPALLNARAIEARQREDVQLAAMMARMRVPVDPKSTNAFDPKCQFCGELEWHDPICPIAKPRLPCPVCSGGIDGHSLVCEAWLLEQGRRRDRAVENAKKTWDATASRKKVEEAIKGLDTTTVQWEDQPVAGQELNFRVLAATPSKERGYGPLPCRFCGVLDVDGHAVNCVVMMPPKLPCLVCRGKNDHFGTCEAMAYQRMQLAKDAAKNISEAELKKNWAKRIFRNKPASQRKLKLDD